MKKKSYLIAATAFLVFVLLGLWVASRLKVNSSSSLTPRNFTESQQNYLLVQVNDLEERMPRVITVWAAFISHTDSTHIVLLPLFPNPDKKVNDRIARTFRLSREGIQGKPSLRQLERQYDLKMDGYIVVDNTALVSLTESLLDQALTPVVETPRDANEIRSILADGKSNLSQLCELLQQQNGADILNRVHWLELLPAHFTTNLSFEALTLELEMFGSSNQIQTCEVLDN